MPSMTRVFVPPADVTTTSYRYLPGSITEVVVSRSVRTTVPVAVELTVAIKLVEVEL